MTNKPKIPVPTEAAEQEKLIRWAFFAAHSRPEFRELNLLAAIPNGGWRRPETGAKLKRQGVRRGFPDLILPVAKGKYHGLFIELKRLKGGHVESLQRDWADSLKAQGYYHAFCYGFEQAKSVLERYLLNAL